ncbi:MAG: hypothetical protein R6W96_01115, partial [Clostridia bacterium]
LHRLAPETADLVFTCRPGRRFTYDQLVITGAPDDLVPLVRRTVSLAPFSGSYRPVLLGLAILPFLGVFTGILGKKPLLQKRIKKEAGHAAAS